MKEATGSTAMIYVLLIFIAVFIAFIAVAFNYARAFRVKNTIIDIIERNEGIENISDTGIDSPMGQIYSYLDSVNYGVDDPDCSGYDFVVDDRGFCIGRSAVTDDAGRENIYYSVQTFAALNFPFLGLRIPIPVRGETRIIVDSDSSPSSVSPLPDDSPSPSDSPLPGDFPFPDDGDDDCAECDAWLEATCTTNGGVWDDSAKECIY